MVQVKEAGAWVHEGAPSKEVNFTVQPRCHTALAPVPESPSYCHQGLPTLWHGLLSRKLLPAVCLQSSALCRWPPCGQGKTIRVFYHPHLICEPALCLITKHTIISCANSWQMGTGLWTQSIQLTQLYNPKWGTLDFGGAKFAA